MKQKDITFQDKLNELRLDISHPHSKGIAYVLLEGTSDIKLFRKLFNLQACKVECVPGAKVKLEECVSILLPLHLLVIGIRDADFLHADNKPNDKPNVFLTDYHDMELVMISQDDIFSALIFEESKLPKEKHLELRENILKTLELISYLKWVNNLESLELKFESGFQDLLVFENLTIDINEYFKRVLSKSPMAKITDFNVLSEKINELKKNNPDLFQISNGHDVIKVLSQYFRSVEKNNNATESSVCSSLRIAFTEAHYKKTKLYEDTLNWSKENNCLLY